MTKNFIGGLCAAMVIMCFGVIAFAARDGKKAATVGDEVDQRAGIPHEADKRAKEPCDDYKLSIHTNGAVRGFWCNTGKATFACVTRVNVPKSPSPYVCIYTNGADGKRLDIPAALSIEDDDVIVQVPSVDGKDVQFVSMTRLRKLLAEAK